jgi:hypothetical protein
VYEFALDSTLMLILPDFGVSESFQAREFLSQLGQRKSRTLKLKIHSKVSVQVTRTAVG